MPFVLFVAVPSLVCRDELPHSSSDPLSCCDEIRTRPPGESSYLASGLPYLTVSMGVSLRMIVKNEEDWVVGAIESVRSNVDEVIIVDNGSTPSTPDRSPALGAKIHKSRKEPFSLRAARYLQSVTPK